MTSVRRVRLVLFAILIITIGLAAVLVPHFFQP